MNEEIEALKVELASLKVQFCQRVSDVEQRLNKLDFEDYQYAQKMVS